jgi:hypothetical protein
VKRNWIKKFGGGLSNHTHTERERERERDIQLIEIYHIYMCDDLPEHSGGYVFLGKKGRSD